MNPKIQSPGIQAPFTRGEVRRLRRTVRRQADQLAKVAETATSPARADMCGELALKLLRASEALAAFTQTLPEQEAA